MLEAQKSIVWIPDAGGPCPNCKRNFTPRSQREDLFGVFDLLVLDDTVQLVQVTTEQTRGQTVTARKWKIEELFLASDPPGRFDVWVWSWVARRHFFAWRWSYGDKAWLRCAPIFSPLISR